MCTPSRPSASRRTFLGIAGTLLPAIPTLAQTSYNEPGMACSPFDNAGVQICTTGIPSKDIQTVYQSQNRSQWCWAACLEMIFRYHGMPIRQEQIVTETFGAQVNLPAQESIILQNVNRQWFVRGRWYLVRSDFTTITPDVAAWELKDRRPLIVGTMGHAMVLTSMSYQRAVDGAGRPFQVVVRDPWPGHGRRELSGQEIFGINPANGGICFRIQVERL